MKHALKFLRRRCQRCLLARLPSRRSMPTPPQAQVWVASWGASQQIPEPQNALPADDLRDATVRQIFHLSVGGSGAARPSFQRVRNRAAPLHLPSTLRGPFANSSPAIDPASRPRRSLSPAKPDVTIPPGAEFVSDPLEFPVAPLSDMAVTYSSRRSARPRNRPSRLACNNLVCPRRFRRRRQPR